MRKNYILRSVVLLLASVFTFASCEKEMDKYYKIPDWLRGNAWEILEADGNYSMFLEGVEISGYKELVSGTGIVTVLAPDDDAFRAFLQSEYGVSTIAAWASQLGSDSLAEIAKVIDNHLIYYSYTQEAFANYNPNGYANPNDGVNQGKYYKFRTHSKDPISTGYIYTASVSNLGNLIKDSTAVSVYHYDRMLPVFSGYTFYGKNIEAKYNYEYFYPNSTWGGSALNNLQFSNASVVEYEIITDNGYIYKVDEVIAPLGTIRSELLEAGDYSTFISMYDRFAYMERDNSLTLDYGNGEDLYLMKHYELPSINLEWATSSSTDFATLASNASTVFAPSNSALNSFFNQYWSVDPEYNSLSDIKLTPLLYLLKHHVYEDFLVFPEEIKQGVQNSFGDNITFDVDNTDLGQICTNGAVYGLQEVITPGLFQSAMEPAFKFSRFNIFLLLTIKSGMEEYIGSIDGINVFYFTDEMLTEHTVYSENEFMYSDSNPFMYSTYNQETQSNTVNETVLIGADGEWSTIGNYTSSALISNHISSGIISSFPNHNIYKTYNNYEYLLVHEENGQKRIFSSGTYNDFLIDNATAIASFQEIPNLAYGGGNGHVYELTGNASVLKPTDLYYVDNVATAASAPLKFATFVARHRDADLTSGSLPLSFLLGTRFIVFIPTNEVMQANADKFPVPDETIDEENDPAGKEQNDQIRAQLQYILTGYYVNVNMSNLSEYPFPGAIGDRTLTTYQGYEETNPSGEAELKYNTLQLIDTGTGLQLIDGTGKRINVITSGDEYGIFFPNIYGDGAVYMIDDIIEF